MTSADTLIQLGIMLADGVAKVILAIINDSSLSQAEKDAAIIRIKGQLKDKDAKVQATPL